MPEKTCIHCKRNPIIHAPKRTDRAAVCEICLVIGLCRLFLDSEDKRESLDSFFDKPMSYMAELSGVEHVAYANQLWDLCFSDPESAYAKMNGTFEMPREDRRDVS